MKNAKGSNMILSASPLAGRYLRVILLLACWLGCRGLADVALGAEFSAKVHHDRNWRQSGATRPPESITVKGNWIRVETFRRGKKVILIHRPDLETTFTVDPGAKSYKELPYMAGGQWFSLYPAYRPMLQAQGRETVAGKTCNKYAAPGNAIVFWICPQLDFPLRIRIGKTFVELSDIRGGPVDSALFAPPPAYRLAFSFHKGKTSAAQLARKTAAVSGQPSPAKKPAPDDNKLFDAGLHAGLPYSTGPFYDFKLKMFVFPGNNGRTKNLNQPIRVRFNHPVQPVFFSFRVEPDPGGWETVWQSDHRSVELRHKTPFEAGKTYTFTATMVGGEQRQVTFTAATPSPDRLLEQDLAAKRIDINQAATYHLLRVIAPSRVPQRYRPRARLKCGSADLRRVMEALPRLNRQTRSQLRPYLLPPTNHESHWYRKLLEAGADDEKGIPFSLVRTARAAMPWYSETYHTDTGFDVMIMGAPREKRNIVLARRLLEEKKIYERLERLMGRKTTHAGDNKLMIFIHDTFSDDEAGVYGFCELHLKKVPGKKVKQEVPWIAISSQACNTKRLLGATLAHEMFHAFQYAFNTGFEDWIGESTAVWAEDYIDKTWNTEQEYTELAFQAPLHELMELDNNTGLGVYGRYIFPFYLTRVSPGDCTVIPEIWKHIEKGQEAVKAVRTTIGDFERLWKKYVLAVLDENLEKGRFPDTANRYGDGPLKLSRFHKFERVKLDQAGIGGLAVCLFPLSAVYIKIVNDNQGPAAPAIRLDLSEFKSDDRISLQAIVIYRDGRSEYEDWSDLDRRVFCLSHKNENFSAIYLVVARGIDEQESGYKSLLLDIYPEMESDCDKGSAVMTLAINGDKKGHQKFKGGAAGFEQNYASWNRHVSVRMKLEPWRDDIPAPAKGALQQLDSNYPGVKASLIKEARKAMKAAMKAPRKFDDPATGCVVFKYRITSCNVRMSGGTYRSSSIEEHRDSMGLVQASRTNYEERTADVKLDDSTRQALDNRRLAVLVYVDRKKGYIKWVQFPLVGVKTRLFQKSSGTSRERYQDSSGFYHYRENDTGWHKDLDSGLQVSFESDVPADLKKPMDPAWRSKTRSRISASGGGQKFRPLAHKWKSGLDSGEISGSETIQLRWRLNLEEKPR